LGFFSKAYSLNNRPHEREQLDQNFRNEIKQHFTDDAQKLKNLTGIDILKA